MREEGKERKEGEGWMRWRGATGDATFKRKTGSVCYYVVGEKKAREMMLHADKRNSCCTDKNGGAQCGATCLPRQDKGQQD